MPTAEELIQEYKKKNTITGGLFPSASTEPMPPGWEPQIPNIGGMLTGGTPSPGLVPSEPKPARIPQEAYGPGWAGGIIPPSAPPTATPPSFVGMPTPTQKSAADLAREDATREWQTHLADIQAGRKPKESGFALSWDFYARHPEISGGVYSGPAGPKFLFTENKPQDTMGSVNNLIAQWVDKATKVMSASSGNPLYDAKVFNQIMNEFPGTFSAQTAAGRAPSEIAKNVSEANRPQLGQFFTGPGQTGAFMIPPGGQPQQFAAGAPPEHNQTLSVGITSLMGHYLGEFNKIQNDPYLQESEKPGRIQALQNEYRNQISAWESMFKNPQGNVPVSQPPRKMTYYEFYTKAKAKGFTDEQVNTEWPRLVQKGLGG